uniref:ADP-ribosyl cyclase/cyclic ADP-ribose hydrolase n=1 Tax=Fagus sylvatica TaxID=28930 RepID=A0A2N9GE65_FAGSY
MGSGRFTKEEWFQPKVKRESEGNIREERQPDLWWLLLFSHSRRETNGKFTGKEKSQTTAKRQPEENVNKEDADQTYGGYYSFCTIDESRARRIHQKGKISTRGKKVFWRQRKQRHESEFIQHIVKVILQKITSKFSSVTKNLVGIDSPLDELITAYLDLGNNVCMMGICGMGGLGKTTLARAVYDKFRSHFEAFKNEQPKEGYMQLSQDVVDYANGLPLALVLLGSFLVGRTMEVWQSALDSFKKIPKGDIYDILKVSYDGLEEMWKEIFLDIACFFRGETKDRVIEILENCGFDVRIGISVLMDKSLLSIENEKLWMHDLLQEMGREIVCRESHAEPGKRSRLWLEEDLFHVLTNDTATEAIQAIVLINSNPWKEGYLNFEDFLEPFSKMCNLRLLIIHHVHIPNGLNHLPNDLRFLELEFFGTEEFVKRNLQISRVKYLWDGVKCFDKLKCINLSNSLLVQTPDFTGLPRLESLDLSWCTNLVEIHPSIGQLRRLVILDLKGCRSLFNFPSMTTEMESLKILNLCYCSKISKIPEFKGIMKSLSELNLRNTTIEKLPFSIECLTALTILNLENCKKLECLPSNIDSLRSLEKLILSNCSKLSYLPENFWKMKCLKELELSRMSGLEGIGFNGIGCLSSLKHLTLSWNSFVNLPATASISQLSKLEALDLYNCHNLQSLPELPSTVRYINAHECYSLQPSPALRRLRSSSQLRKRRRRYRYNESSGGVAFTILNRYLQALLGQKTGYETSTERKEDGSGTAFQIIIPGFEIPRWITHQSFGKSLRIELPPNWCNSRWIGFTLCALLEGQSLYTSLRFSEAFGFSVRVIALGDSHYDTETFFRTTYCSGHIWLLYLSRDDWFATVQNGECSQIEVVFGTSTIDSTVLKCGVSLVYQQHEEEFNQTIAQCDSNGVISYEAVLRKLKASSLHSMPMSHYFVVKWDEIALKVTPSPQV